MAEQQTVPAEKTEQPPVDGGNVDPNGAAPETPTWLAEALGDEDRRKDMLKFARATFDEDFTGHKKASEERERSLRGQLHASDYWKNLDEDGRKAIQDGAVLREDAIEVWSDRVPKSLLAKFSTAKGVREFATEYIEANGGATPKQAAEKNGDDLESRMAENIAKRLGIVIPPPTEEIARGNGRVVAQAQSSAALAKVDLRGMNATELAEHDKKLDAARRAEGWGR